MSTKLSNLNELRNILTQKEKADEGVLAFSKQFKIGHLLKPFSAAKKQGYSLMFILWLANQIKQQTIHSNSLVFNFSSLVLSN